MALAASLSAVIERAPIRVADNVPVVDVDACNGCGACAEACHEGAIAMVDGRLVEE